jgi:hypothetical protein
LLGASFLGNREQSAGAIACMPAKAGIQQGFAEILDSRLRGNDKPVDSDSI